MIGKFYISQESSPQDNKFSPLFNSLLKLFVDMIRPSSNVVKVNNNVKKYSKKKKKKPKPVALLTNTVVKATIKASSFYALNFCEVKFGKYLDQLFYDLLLSKRSLRFLHLSLLVVQIFNVGEDNIFLVQQFENTGIELLTLREGVYTNYH